MGRFESRRHVAPEAPRLVPGSPLRRRFRGRRPAAVLTTLFLFLLPVLVVIGLCLIQLVLLVAARQHVEMAARAAALIASRGASMDVIHDQAGLVLGFLGGDYKTQREYFDVWDDAAQAAGSDGLITAGDEVAVGVTIPLGLVSTNYMGMLGVNVNDLHVRAVYQRTMTEDGDLSCPP